MRRFAIGYLPVGEQADRPEMVFVEATDGVLVLRRGEAAPKLLKEPIVDTKTADETAGPVIVGDPTYFDIVLDSYSTSVFIRTVTDFEPDLFASMLVAEENWDLLPRPGVPA